MVKELQLTDIKYYKDVLITLKHLSKVDELSENQFETILKRILNQDGHIFICIENEQVVSCVTLLIEQKIIRGGAIAGHIEDVVTREGFEHKGYATKTLNFALDYAKKRGCYKVVLYCKDKLETFYNKTGFAKEGINMKLRFDE